MTDAQSDGQVLHTTRLQKAQFLLDAKRVREAAALAAQAVASQPSDPRAWTMLAHCYESLQDLPRALETVNRAIGLNPSDPEPHMVASRVLRSLGKTDEAIRAGQEAVNLAPMDAATRSTLAVALASADGQAAFFGLLRSRNIRVAADHARQAMTLSPTSTAGHFAAGFVAAASGRPRQARAHYQRVLTMNPQSAASINNLAALDLRRGRLTRSGSGFAQALVTDPTMNLARRNVRRSVIVLISRFHWLAWVIYWLYGIPADNSRDEVPSFAWGQRSTIACCIGLLYAILAGRSYARMEQNVRRFAAHMIADSWALKAVVAADTFIFVCFISSTISRGHVSAGIHDIGLIGIAIALTVLTVLRFRC